MLGLIDYKKFATQALNQQVDEVVELSHRIHSHPELGFEEERACQWISDLLAEKGFSVERNTAGLQTAFTANVGSGPLNIVLCAEYDALPGIGHACGHNIIAACAAGAALALRPFVADCGIKITVLGTPAEEIGNASGKILLLERGAFRGAHAALMVHPAPWDSIHMKYQAAAAYTVEYHGRGAHASASPELGINAGDALTVAQVGIGLLRQHLRSAEKVHGITVNGGAAPNVIPDFTSARYILRADTLAGLGGLATRVRACFEAGAMASGCRLAISGGDKPYAEMKPDRELLALYKSNAERLGRRFMGYTAPASASASTDMGNVSQQIPSIHPCIGIRSYPAVNHQAEFAACCVTASADKAVRDGSLALAWTILDLAIQKSTCERLLRGTSERK